MSTTAVIILIVVVLAIIAGNILLLRKSTDFKVDKQTLEKVKKRNAEQDEKDDW